MSIGRLRRQSTDPVALDMTVSGHENQPFGLGLGDQEPIKRVAVVHGQQPSLLSMKERHIKRQHGGDIDRWGASDYAGDASASTTTTV